MEPERPRPGALSDLEAKLLAAAVGKRLFQKPAEPVELGRYRLLGRIGQGGMSVVFRAHDPQLRREVAVKLLHSPRGAPDPEHQARLRREAHALGRLSHPNVVQVFEIGEVDGQTFVVMELVRGTTLREWLRASPRPLPKVVATAAQAGRGLAAAHAAGIVHRDLKPENVLIGEDGRARVVDFGLARASPGTAPPVEQSTASLAAPLTRTGTVLGTPAFMAPEQLREAGRADARSDQFSFCVMLYEALYGERPFDDLAATTIRPPPAGAQVPPPLREALLRGLQHDPDQRWPTMDALLARLEAATQAPEPTPSPTPHRADRRWLALAGAGLLAAAAAWWLARPAPAPSSPPTVHAELAALLAANDLAAAERLLATLPDDQLNSLADAPGHVFADLRDFALTERATRLLQQGRVEAAARTLRLSAGPHRPDAGALSAELRALLAARTRLSPRFTGPAAAPWTALEPAALRRDPVADALLLATGEPALLAAWSLDPRSDRLLVELHLELPTLDPGASLTVGITSPGATAELTLHAPADSEEPHTPETSARREQRPDEGAEPNPRTPEASAHHPAESAKLNPHTPETNAAGEQRPDESAKLNPHTPSTNARRERTQFKPRAAGPGAEEPALRLGCGTGASGSVSLERATSVTLQLDVDARRGAVTCRALDGRGELLARDSAALPAPLTPGPLRLELRSGESARMRAVVTRLELYGALPAAPPPTDPLARAGALLVEGDAAAAATALAALETPHAGLWRAIALIRLGRWQEAAVQLEQALTADHAEIAELQKWLRADPQGLAPALRQLLGDSRYLDLFLETWRRELTAPLLPPELIRITLAELGGIDERCEARLCAELRRAYGRALAQIGEPARARRALESALAAAPDDAAGRALASQLVLDLALVHPPR